MDPADHGGSTRSAGRASPPACVLGPTHRLAISERRPGEGRVELERPPEVPDGRIVLAGAMGRLAGEIGVQGGQRRARQAREAIRPLPRALRRELGGKAIDQRVETIGRSLDLGLGTYPTRLGIEQRPVQDQAPRRGHDGAQHQRAGPESARHPAGLLRGKIFTLRSSGAAPGGHGGPRRHDPGAAGAGELHFQEIHHPFTQSAGTRVGADEPEREDRHEAGIEPR